MPDQPVCGFFRFGQAFRQVATGLPDGWTVKVK